MQLHSGLQKIRSKFMKNLSNSFAKKAGSLFIAGAMALSPVGSYAQPANGDKEHVSLNEYCAIQQDRGDIARNDYTPYKEGDSVVDVPVHSDVHGNITINNFNCVALPPNCSTRGFYVTRSALIMMHAGLGSLNNSDTASQRKAYELLAKVPGLVSPTDSDALAANDHLKNYHGLDLLETDGNQFGLGDDMKNVMQACVAKLDM